jgi:predicted GNAT family acetyltransferase
MRAYYLEALKAADDDKLEVSVQERVTEFQASSSTWVLLSGERPVSLSAFNAQYRTVVQVGPVWTPVEFRGQGFARRLLAETLRQASPAAQEAVLFTYNPSAARCYESIGFQKIGKFLLAFMQTPVLIN